MKIAHRIYKVLMKHFAFGEPKIWSILTFPGRDPASGIALRTIAVFVEDMRYLNWPEK